jgi:hypothetical protein
MPSAMVARCKAKAFSYSDVRHIFDRCVHASLRVVKALDFFEHATLPAQPPLPHVPLKVIPLPHMLPL